MLEPFLDKVCEGCCGIDQADLYRDEKPRFGDIPGDIEISYKLLGCFVSLKTFRFFIFTRKITLANVAVPGVWEHPRSCNNKLIDDREVLALPAMAHRFSEIEAGKGGWPGDKTRLSGAVSLT